MKKLKSNCIFFIPCFWPVLLSLILFSCANETIIEGQTDAEILFKDAQSLIKDERYIMATEKLNQIRSKHPYSYYATHAELLQADVFFLQESYVEAASAYILFKDFHPKNKKISYVVWRIAESFFNQLPSTFDRDLSVCSDAVFYYEELISKHKNSDYLKMSLENIGKCSQMVRDRNQYVGDFYFRTKDYKSAIFRYQSILKNFSEKNIREHSIIRIVKSSLKLKNKEECLKYHSLYQAQISKSGKEYWIKL